MFGTQTRNLIPTNHLSPAIQVDEPIILFSVILPFYACTQQNRTPLIASSRSGFLGIVKILLEKIKEFPEDEKQKYLDHEMRVSNNY